MIRPVHWLLTLLALTLSGAPLTARAACYLNNGTSWATVTFTPPAQIMVPDNAAVGTVLWTSPMTSQSAEADLYCDQYTNGGIVNYQGAQVPGGSTIFPTIVPGVGVRLSRGSLGSYLIASPSDYVTSGTTQFNLNTALEFVVTGPVAIGQSINASQLVNWAFGSVNPVVTFVLGSNTTFVGPACTVATDPTVVQLPTVTVGAFGGNGSTTGTTPFAVQLSCSYASPIQITLDSTNPVSVNNGVLSIATGTGMATGVGVQISRSGNPTKLRKAITVNATPGSFSIPFAASYYRTGTIKAGSVSATATYTLTYP